MFALQCVGRRQLSLFYKLVKGIKVLKRIRRARQRGEHRSNKRVTCARDIDDLFLGDLDGWEVFQDDDARARLVACDDLAREDVAALRGPCRFVCVLAGDAEGSDKPALTALDDQVLEERQEIDCHLSDAVVHQEGEVTRGGRLVSDCTPAGQLLKLHAEIRTEAHVVHDLPPVLVRSEFQRRRAGFLIHMGELEHVRRGEGYWCACNTRRV